MVSLRPRKIRAPWTLFYLDPGFKFPLFLMGYMWWAGNQEKKHWEKGWKNWIQIVGTVEYKYIKESKET